MSGMTAPSFHSQDFALDTISLTVEFLSDIMLDIQALSGFSSAREFYWNREISQLTSDVSRFVELTTLLSKALVHKNRKLLLEIKSSHIHLLFIIKGMNQAQIRNDFVALEELIKYELKDNLTQWKIDFIPQIKKQLNT